MAYDIVIVDDEKRMRKLLRKIISIEHNIIGEAKNGREAVKEYKKLNPDLVLMDVKMPTMDGFEALSEIKNLDDSQKVIMCTSMDDHKEVAGAMKRGADAYLVKPYKKDQLLNTIEEVMG
ncbi:MAG: response regulator [Candidatus Thermoplasmatota archaeon]